MSDRAKKITELPLLTDPVGTDLLIIEDDPAGIANTKAVSVTNLLGNSSANIVASNTAYLVIKRSNTPANSTITVQAGAMWADSNYLYIAVANNVLKRVSLSSF